MADENPHLFSTQTTGVAFGQITDNTDFPHTGLIKGLSLMSKGNMAVKGSATDFDITQASSSNVIQVATGRIFKDNKLTAAVVAKNFTSSSFITTAGDSYYHLLVVDASNVLQVRKHGSDIADKVPDYTEGDTIIAVIMFNSSTAPLGSMQIQFLTTGKVENSLSLGYDSSGYTEMSKVTAASGGTTVEVATAGGDFIIDNTDADKKIIMRLGSDDANTDFEIRNNSDAVKFAVDGAGTITLAALPTATLATDDKVVIRDTNGSDAIKTVTAQSIADLAGITNELVRYGLTSDEGLSSGSRYTFTSADFTAYAADTNVVTFSGENITLKGAGIFEVNLYGYFAAAAGGSGNLEFDLSIGDGNQHNKYAYNRYLAANTIVVRFSQFTTATIKTTGDTIIKLSGYMVFGGGSGADPLRFLATGSSDPQSANNPQYTAFTIRKVA